MPRELKRPGPADRAPITKQEQEQEEQKTKKHRDLSPKRPSDKETGTVEDSKLKRR